MPSVDEYVQKLKDSTKDYSPYGSGLAIFGAGVVSLFAGRKIHNRYFRRIPNGDWITPNVFKRKLWIKGYVTSVGDADNFRVYHTPAFGWRWPLKFRRIPDNPKDLKDKTIHIRIAGVDAPEGAHFGRPAQFYADEALAWLRNRILGKTVYCQLLRRDQYARIISVVQERPLFLPGTLFNGKNLALEMLKAGCGTIYEQAGAEYGKWGKETFQKVEAEAQAARRGMWSRGTKGESPAEYKRRYAQAETETAKKPAPVARDFPPKSWFRRLWFRS